MSLFTKVLYKQERKNVNGKKSVTLFEKKFYKVSTYRKFNSFPKKLAFIFSLAFAGSVVAAPVLNNVQYNGANISVNQVGNATNVLANAGNNSIINWNSFDIGSGESVNFNHNGSGHRFFNIVNGPASTIAGQVNAINPNTDVFILNLNGISLQNGAQINVSGNFFLGGMDSTQQAHLLTNIEFSGLNSIDINMSAASSINIDTGASITSGGHTYIKTDLLNMTGGSINAGQDLKIQTSSGIIANANLNGNNIYLENTDISNSVLNATTDIQIKSGSVSNGSNLTAGNDINSNVQTVFTDSTLQSGEYVRLENADSVNGMTIDSKVVFITNPSQVNNSNITSQLNTSLVDVAVVDGTVINGDGGSTGSVFLTNVNDLKNSSISSYYTTISGAAVTNIVDDESVKRLPTISNSDFSGTYLIANQFDEISSSNLASTSQSITKVNKVQDLVFTANSYLELDARNIKNVSITGTDMVFVTNKLNSGNGSSVVPITEELIVSGVNDFTLNLNGNTVDTSNISANKINLNVETSSTILNTTLTTAVENSVVVNGVVPNDNDGLGGLQINNTLNVDDSVIITNNSVTGKDVLYKHNGINPVGSIDLIDGSISVRGTELDLKNLQYKGVDVSFFADNNLKISNSSVEGVNVYTNATNTTIDNSNISASNFISIDSTNQATITNTQFNSLSLSINSQNNMSIDGINVDAKAVSLNSIAGDVEVKNSTIVSKNQTYVGDGVYINSGNDVSLINSKIDSQTFIDIEAARNVNLIGNTELIAAQSTHNIGIDGNLDVRGNSNLWADSSIEVNGTITRDGNEFITPSPISANGTLENWGNNDNPNYAIFIKGQSINSVAAPGEKVVVRAFSEQTRPVVVPPVEPPTPVEPPPVVVPPVEPPTPVEPPPVVVPPIVPPTPVEPPPVVVPPVVPEPTPIPMPVDIIKPVDRPTIEQPVVIQMVDTANIANVGNFNLMTVETKKDIKVPEISDKKIYLPVSSNTPKININNDIVLVNVEDEKIEK